MSEAVHEDAAATDTEQPTEDKDSSGSGGGSMFYVKRPKDVSEAMMIIGVCQWFGILWIRTSGWHCEPLLTITTIHTITYYFFGLLMFFRLEKGWDREWGTS